MGRDREVDFESPVGFDVGSWRAELELADEFARVGELGEEWFGAVADPVVPVIEDLEVSLGACERMGGVDEFLDEGGGEAGSILRRGGIIRERKPQSQCARGGFRVGEMSEGSIVVEADLRQGSPTRMVLESEFNSRAEVEVAESSRFAYAAVTG